MRGSGRRKPSGIVWKRKQALRYYKTSGAASRCRGPSSRRIPHRTARAVPLQVYAPVEQDSLVARSKAFTMKHDDKRSLTPKLRFPKFREETACEPAKQEFAFAQTYFALIRSKGDHALFGKSTQAMKAQWRVPDGRPLADFAPTIILKAKDFAAEITIHNARTHNMRSEPQISREHVSNNQAVRQTLLNRGIRPESLPAAEDVKKVERRLSSDEKKALQTPEKLEGE